MEFELRRTHNLLEIKVNQSEYTLYESYDNVFIKEMIENVTELLDHLYDMTGLELIITTEPK